MAITADNFEVKFTVTGGEQLTNAANQTANLGKNAAAAGQNVRNFGFQVQDFAVQVSNGTSALTAFSQQAPQLLSVFGTVGIYLGIVAAALPVFVTGLKLAGVEFRNLKEMTDDLQAAADDYQKSAAKGQVTLEGNRATYKTLGDEAFRFFQIQTDLNKIRFQAEYQATLGELRDKFKFVRQEIDLTDKSLGGFGTDAMLGAAINNAVIKIRANMNGLRTEDVRYLDKELRGLGENAGPKEVAQTINRIQEYIKANASETKNFATVWREVIAPLANVTNALLEQDKIIGAQAINASKLATAFLNLQAAYIPRVAEARRNFDEITAIRLQGEEKIAAKQLEIADKVKFGSLEQSQANRELAAFRAKTNAEVLAAEQAIANQQKETARSASLQNDTRIRQLDVEKAIVQLQDEGRYTLGYQVDYEVAILRNVQAQADSIKNISEQRRKNQITAEQEAELIKEANLIRGRADSVAEAQQRKRIRDAKDVQNATLEELDAKIRTVGYEDEYLKIRQRLRNGYQEDIDTEVKIAQLKNQQAEAERKINEQALLGKITNEDAAEQIGKSRIELERSLRLERERNREASRYRTGTFEEGITDALAKISKDIPSEYQKAGKIVDSVFNNIGSALDRMVDSGKLSFRDLAESIIKDIIKIELRASMSKVFAGSGGLFGMLGGFLGLGGGGGFGTGSAFGNMDFGGFFAEGGVLGAGKYGIAGEAGPELIRGPASITPMRAQPQPIVNNVYNISAIDSRSVAQFFAENRMAMLGTVRQAEKELPFRGGR